MSSSSPFEFVTNINQKKGRLEVEKEGVSYPNFIINKAFSNNIDTVLYANEVNQDMDNQLHYDFFYYAIPKGKRYGKWFKKSAKQYSEQMINLVCDYYGYGEDKAIETLTVLTECNLLDQFLLLSDKGGRTK